MILTVEQLIKELSKLPPNSVPYIWVNGKELAFLIERISEETDTMRYFERDEHDILENDENLKFVEISTHA